MKTETLDYTQMDIIQKGDAGRMAREWREKARCTDTNQHVNIWAQICNSHGIAPDARRKWVAPVAYALEHVLGARFQCRDILLAVANCPDLETRCLSVAPEQAQQMAAAV